MTIRDLVETRSQRDAAISSMDYRPRAASTETQTRGFGRDRAQYETAALSESSIWQLIEDISHELNNPLQHLKGFTALLSNQSAGTGDIPAREYLEIIADEVVRLDRLVEDLSNVSRIASGTLELEISYVAVDELVRRSVQRWQHVMTHSFEVGICQRGPSVPVDALRLDQVLDNLFANATRHTPEGTRVVVSVAFNTEEVIVSIQDNGPGIAECHTPFLFDRCYQGERQGRRRERSGLGLYICRQIIELHHGHIWVETAPKSGTTIRFSLPLQSCSDFGQAIVLPGASAS